MPQQANLGNIRFRRGNLANALRSLADWIDEGNYQVVNIWLGRPEGDDEFLVVAVLPKDSDRVLRVESGGPPTLTAQAEVPVG